MVIENLKILYIYPYESYGIPSFLINFIRISNYLHSRKDELKSTLKEEYLDLRFENLPIYNPNNLKDYRDKLKTLLIDIFNNFNFNIVAISCYSSYNYLNSIEVAWMIKKYINPNSLIVVGGVHATMRPQDFQPHNLPIYFQNKYNKEMTPFDFLIKEEGEIPFFNLIKDFSNGTLKPRKNLTERCKILEPILFENLDKLPPIELSLFKKYKDAFKKYPNFYIDFSRGCLFRCKICPTSEDYFDSYKHVRYKSIKKCIQELKIIRDTSWLSIYNVYIVDLTFLPSKKRRKSFYNELEEIYNNEGELPFNLYINERVELCSDEDLISYQKFKIIPLIGLETGSKTLLYKIGKVLGNNPSQVKKAINRFLRRTEDIIIKSNKLELPTVLYYMMGLPGEDLETIKENKEFFFNPRFDGKGLIEKYKINLSISKYTSLFGSYIYTHAENDYGAKIYYKFWWKHFHMHQPYLGALVDPSEGLTFSDSMSKHLKLLKMIFKSQRKLNNPFYSPEKLIFLKRHKEILSNIYQKIVRIVYIYPYESVGKKFCLPGILRIQNYLNSKVDELNGFILEEYIDLKNENLPKYIPDNLENYREALYTLLNTLYNKFEFNIVLISTFDTFNYANTVEIASLIKKRINKNAIIVVNGVHASTCPNDYQPGNLPAFIADKYSGNNTPFDILIKEEGEIPFFNIIKEFIEGTLEVRNGNYHSCKIVGPEIIKDLNEVPTLSLSLLKKYKKKINLENTFYLEFNRGCIFKCNYCSISGKNIKCLSTMRYKSIQKCLEDLRVIRDTKWLNVDNVVITDLIFFPKKRIKNEIFTALERLYRKEGPFPFKIYIMDRVDLCSISDLDSYKKLGIIPLIGLESGSKKNLYQMNKVLGKDKNQVYKAIDRYLNKTVDLIKYSNKISLNIVFFYLIGLPGEDLDCIKETTQFFLKPRFEGKSLVEKYNINLNFSKYALHPGSVFYNTAEEQYGSKFYYKEWWKILHENKEYFSALIDPSNKLTLKESLYYNLRYINEIFERQMKKGNKFYTRMRYLVLKKKFNKLLEIYEKITENIEMAKPKGCEEESL